jgi:hypothetical protein
MRLVVAVMVVAAVVAAGCAGPISSSDTSAVSTTEASLPPETTTDAPPPSTSTTSTVTTTSQPVTTTRPTTTTTIPVPPSMTLVCPEEVTYPSGTTVRVEFGYSFGAGSSTITNWHINYGDGGTWDSPNAKHAEDNLFWHIYESPGSFEPRVTLTDEAGLTVSDACEFNFHWTQVSPPPASHPPTDNVSMSSAYNGWSGFIGDDRVLLTEGYNGWSGFIGDDRVLLTEGYNSVSGTGPRSVAALVPILFGEES